MSADSEGVNAAALHVLLNEMALNAEREAASALAQFRLLKRLGDRDGMRKMLLRAIKFAPDLVPARQHMAQLCLEEGELRNAREQADAGLALEPENPKLLRLRRKADGSAPPGRAPNLAVAGQQ